MAGETRFWIGRNELDLSLSVAIFCHKIGLKDVVHLFDSFSLFGVTPILPLTGLFKVNH